MPQTSERYPVSFRGMEKKQAMFTFVPYLPGDSVRFGCVVPQVADFAPDDVHATLAHVLLSHTLASLAGIRHLRAIHLAFSSCCSILYGRNTCTVWVHNSCVQSKTQLCFVLAGWKQIDCLTNSPGPDTIFSISHMNKPKAVTILCVHYSSVARSSTVG